MKKLTVTEFGEALAKLLDGQKEQAGQMVDGARFYKARYTGDLMVQVYFSCGQILRLGLVDVTGIEPRLSDIEGKAALVRDNRFMLG